MIHFKTTTTIVLLSISGFIFAQAKSVEIVGNDSDSHGCKASAGYTYSILKKECIRTFEEKIQLKEVLPKKPYTVNAAVVLSNDKKKVELFLPDYGYKNSVILKRKGNPENYSWEKGDLKLSKDFILTKGGVVIYKQK
jgi:hypothetical protein